MSRKLAIAFATSILAACASSPRATPSALPDQDDVGFRIFQSSSGRFVPFSQLADAMSRADIVFFGEQHDDPATHVAELTVLRALGSRRANVVLSLEMFERDVQAALNDYLAGRISESAFLADARPWDRYASDYRPLVELARARGWPVIAANVPRQIASEVSRQGLPFITAMPPAERANVAAEISCPRDNYYDRFAQTMQSHLGVNTADSVAARAALQRYYEAQCIKDETMAESIVSARNRAGGGAVLLHVNGSFHSDYHLGTVQRVARRMTNTRILVLAAVPVPDPGTAPGVEYAQRADFILFTRRAASY